jgi:hypothetical protein
MAVVAHLIILVRHSVFAFTRLMAVAPALALALIVGHLVPPHLAALVRFSGGTPPSRASEIQRAAASSRSAVLVTDQGTGSLAGGLGDPDFYQPQLRRHSNVNECRLLMPLPVGHSLRRAFYTNA